jgi:hypothetical protein
MTVIAAASGKTRKTNRVIPAQAGIHSECHMAHRMDSRFRGNDKGKSCARGDRVYGSANAYRKL